jgi:uncharacterized protein (TIGR01777 family)
MAQRERLKVILAGGSGFLGQSLAHSLIGDGHEVIVLGRKYKKNNNFVGRFVEWDAVTLSNWNKELEGAYALFNLTGRSVDCRYTKKNRELILNSRIDSTRVLGEAIKNCEKPPKVWLNASTATIYNDLRGDAHPHDESSKANAPGFSEDVGRLWEEEFFKQGRDGVRQVALRISIVLGKGGGAFPVMKRFTELGLGGAQGPGSQWMSWLHLDDWVGIARFLMENDSIEGPVNLAAPHPITNAEFMKEMRECFAPLGIGFPAPTPAVYLGAFFMGTAPELVLKSRKVVSKVLKHMGYDFNHLKLSSALEQLSH